MHPRHTMASLAVLAGTVLTGCGSDPAAGISDPNGARLVPGIALTATISVTGELSGNGTYTDSISPAATAGSCVDAARGFNQDGRRYAVPRPPQPFLIGGRLLTVVTHVQNYRGPGSYTTGDLAGEDGVILLAVDSAYGYVAAAGATATLTVNTDGSGSFTFDKLTLQPKPSAAPTDATPLVTAPPGARSAPASVSGKLTWSCVQVQGSTPSVH